MELDKLGEEIAKAVVAPLEVLQQRQADQRDRWFVENADGVKEEVRETHKINGVEREISLIGLEVPDKVILSKVTIKLDSDLVMEKPQQSGVRRLVSSLFSGSEKSSEIELETEFEHVEASEGLMALHRRAVNEIKHYCMEVPIEEESEEDNG